MPDSRTKTCLITGAAGGIGRALVRVFGDSGHHVIATDRVPQPHGLSCAAYLEIDLLRLVRDESYAQNALSNIRQSFDGDRLDALINNAAVQILGGADTLSREDWRNTLDVNVVAPFLLIQALLPQLEAAKGSVINIGSIHARLTKRDFVAYATSKAALAGMTRALAVDLGPRVRINAIEPAAIDTEMLKAGFEGKPEQYARLAKSHPQGRIGQADEVARLSLSVADGDMGFLHGACIGLDGGMSGRLFDPD
jgi:NAD(P)-dependent dehydrogenase (short-subunit alcohol dehydrogenase family)